MADREIMEGEKEIASVLEKENCAMKCKFWVKGWTDWERGRWGRTSRKNVIQTEKKNSQQAERYWEKPLWSQNKGLKAITDSDCESYKKRDQYAAYLNKHFL